MSKKVRRELCGPQGRDYTPSMGQEPGQRRSGLRAPDVARVFSPLLFFFAHVAYLALWSPDPFLNKWIDGSFTFFVALVLCNIIRARLQRDDSDENPDSGDGHVSGPGA